MVNYWLFTTTLDHANNAVKKGIIQQRYKSRLDKMNIGDKFIIYATKTKYGYKTKYQKVVAKGKIIGNTYSIKINNKKYFRRKAYYYKSNHTPIKKVLNKLSFVKKTNHWGLYFISGFRQIKKKDYNLF